jgi:glycerophosphoryl diester phosphodiesterase
MDARPGLTEIGGIPLPEKLPRRTISSEQFPFHQHRGFGENAFPHYQKDTGPVSVQNTITGLEMAVAGGVQVIEVDLMPTKDGDFVLFHPLSPTQREITQSTADYLKTNPESPTLNELLDWLAHQDTRVSIYLELKGKTEFAAIFDQIKAVDPTGEHQLLKRLMLYGSDNNQIKGYLEEKKTRGLTTDDLKLWLIHQPQPVDGKLIDEVSALGEDNNRIYGIEQGMIPWGFGDFKKAIPTFFGGIGKPFSEVVDYVHSKGLKLITGTVDDSPQTMRWLVEQGVDGIVPNNAAADYHLAGIDRPPYEVPQKLAVDPENPQQPYLPKSLKQRLNI